MLETAQRKKILLIFPRWPERSLWGNFRYKFPSLGLLTIAGATPPGYEVEFIDENVSPLSFDTDAQLVGISVMTPLAPRAYEIAGAFRARGKTVVLGGIHVSVQPEEALLHADAIAVGEGENSWRRMLADFERGGLQRRYDGGPFSDLSEVPEAKRSLLQEGAYITRGTIQLTRGCPYDCEYCSVTSFFGRRFRTRPLEHFLAEYRKLSDRFVFIVDDNILSNRKAAVSLFEQLAGNRTWWGSQVTINVADDEKMLKLMAKSGCKALFIGFESLSQDNLKKMGKNFVDARKHEERIKRIQDQGIGILGSFIVGYDFDSPQTFDDLYDFIIRTKLNAFLVSVLTPFPGTKLTARMEAEGRVLSKDWRLYDMNTVVYRPATFSPDDLQDRYNELNRALYSVSSIVQRSFKLQANSLIFVPQNFGYRQAWKKVLRQPRQAIAVDGKAAGDDKQASGVLI